MYQISLYQKENVNILIIKMVGDGHEELVKVELINLNSNYFLFRAWPYCSLDLEWNLGTKHGKSGFIWSVLYATLF